MTQLWGATAASQLFTRSHQWRLTIEGAQFTLKAGEQTCAERILLLDKLEIEAGAFCALFDCFWASSSEKRMTAIPAQRPSLEKIDEKREVTFGHHICGISWWGA